MDHEIANQQEINQNSSNSVDEVRKGTTESSSKQVNEVQQGTSDNSSSPVDGKSEAVVVISIVETESIKDRNLEAKVDDLETTKGSVEEQKMSVPEPERHACVVDIKHSSVALSVEKGDGEKLCRICHLSSDGPSETSDIMQLGCGCKDELGGAHRHCAEAWFRLKGNRYCEICGEAAKNITGVGDNRFMEQWNGRRNGSGSSSSERRGGCWREQPFCNFLMACLVIAFVLPWFFRVNMF